MAAGTLSLQRALMMIAALVVAGFVLAWQISWL